MRNIEKLGIAITLIGIAISTYLLYIRIFGLELECGVTSCGIVNNSEYAIFLGVPVSAWGLLFYLGMGALLFMKQQKLFFLGAITGVLFSAYLTYLEAFVIKAWCQWCILSAWLAIALLVIAIRNVKMKDESAESS